MITEQEELFLNTLDDLEKRTNSSNSYEILGISLLLRKLLLDEQPLLDQVNRNYKRRIIFKCAKAPSWPENLPQPSLISAQDGIDPDTSISAFTVEELKRDQFLKFVVATTKDEEISVKDVILYEAHVKGGVHSGAAKKDAEKSLEAATEFIRISGHRISTRQLLSIGRVILKATRELRDEIESKI